MTGKNIVILHLKRSPPSSSSNLEPPPKAFPTPLSNPKSSPKKAPPKPRSKELSKVQTNKIRAAGKNFKVGNYVYVTERKCIGRIDSIEFKSEESKDSYLNVTW